MRIAAFGFRSIPLSNGSAGADKFADELLPRLVIRGHEVTAYNRIYNVADKREDPYYKGVKMKSFTTVNVLGFDTLYHSFKCTLDIIINNTADVVHIQNGGNSIFAIILKLFGKKVFISQDGVDWKRDKWPWYAKLYIKLSSFISAYVPNMIIFDNVFAKKYFETKFKRKYEFIPFGSELKEVADDYSVLDKYELEKGEYYLFVGRFIPDKGLHYLIPAFLNSHSKKKLLLIGGSPYPSEFEKSLKSMGNHDLIKFTGFLYGDDVQRLMKYSYCYIQPSDIEGLSPVVLSVMGLGVPIIVSDIPENIYAVGETSLSFKRGNIDDLTEIIKKADSEPELLKELAKKAQVMTLSEYNWEKVTDSHIEVFNKY